MKKCKRCKMNETPPGIATCADCRAEIEQKKKTKIDRVARELGEARQQRRVHYTHKTPRRVIDAADILRRQTQEMLRRKFNDAYSLALARHRQGLL